MALTETQGQQEWTQKGQERSSICSVLLLLATTGKAMSNKLQEQTATAQNCGIFSKPQLSCKHLLFLRGFFVQAVFCFLQPKAASLLWGLTTNRALASQFLSYSFNQLTQHQEQAHCSIMAKSSFLASFLTQVIIQQVPNRNAL